MKSLEAVLTRAVSHSKDVPVMRELGLCSELIWDLNKFWTLEAQGNRKEEIEDTSTSLDRMDNVKGQKIHLGDNFLDEVGT